MSEPSIQNESRSDCDECRPEDKKLGGQNAAYWQALHADIDAAQKLLASIRERVPDGHEVVDGIGSP